jgi:hypothetical protein
MKRTVALSIGGFGGPSYSVFIQDDRLTYKAYSQEGEPSSEEIMLSESKWAEFVDFCKRIGITKWKILYEPKELVCDGTGWEFNIDSDEIIYHGEGSNVYPKGFKKFLSSVQRLINGLAFE